MFKKLVILLLSLPLWQAVFAPAPLPPDTIQACEEDWQFASNCCQSFEIWRQEMNYWYDKCIGLPDFCWSEPIDDKMELLQKNKTLEEDNKILKEKLDFDFPDLNKLDDYDLKKLASDKDSELFAIKNAHQTAAPNLDARKAEIKELETKFLNIKSQLYEANIDAYAKKQPAVEEYEALLTEKLALQKQLAEQEAQKKLTKLQNNIGNLATKYSSDFERVKALKKKQP